MRFSLSRYTTKPHFSSLFCFAMNRNRPAGRSTQLRQTCKSHWTFRTKKRRRCSTNSGSASSLCSQSMKAKALTSLAISRPLPPDTTATLSWLGIAHALRRTTFVRWSRGAENRRISSSRPETISSLDTWGTPEMAIQYSPLPLPNLTISITPFVDDIYAQARLSMHTGPDNPEYLRAISHLSKQIREFQRASKDMYNSNPRHATRKSSAPSTTASRYISCRSDEMQEGGRPVLQGQFRTSPVLEAANPQSSCDNSTNPGGLLSCQRLDTNHLDRSDPLCNDSKYDYQSLVMAARDSTSRPRVQVIDQTFMNTILEEVSNTRATRRDLEGQMHEVTGLAFSDMPLACASPHEDVNITLSLIDPENRELPDVVAQLLKTSEPNVPTTIEDAMRSLENTILRQELSQIYLETLGALTAANVQYTPCPTTRQVRDARRLRNRMVSARPSRVQHLKKSHLRTNTRLQSNDDKYNRNISSNQERRTATDVLPLRVKKRQIYDESMLNITGNTADDFGCRTPFDVRREPAKAQSHTLSEGLVLNATKHGNLGSTHLDETEPSSPVPDSKLSAFNFEAQRPTSTSDRSNCPNKRYGIIFDFLETHVQLRSLQDVDNPWQSKIVVQPSSGLQTAHWL